MAIFRFCAVCDEVRLEAFGNKSILIGFFGMLPYVDIAVPHPSEPIARIAFLFMSGEPVVAGKYRISLSVKGPNGQELIVETTPVIEQDAIAAPLNATFLVQPMQLAGSGKYRVTVLVNDKEDFGGDLFVSQAPLPN
jgi:hypothetical protein